MDGTQRAALVAGATRGAGRAVAVELARAGFFVYATGRSTREGRSEIDRPDPARPRRERRQRERTGAAASRAGGLLEDAVRRCAGRAHHTPAYTPFFAMASALVTDVGRPLPHSSIVVREYGFPTVLGTGSATARIKDGDEVAVDGVKGIVLLAEAD